MLIALFILSVFSIWFGNKIVDKTSADKGVGFCVVGVITIFFILVISIVITTGYISSLGYIKGQDKLILAKQEQLKMLQTNLKETLEMYKQPGFTANQDSPIKSLVESITSTNKELGDIKTKVAENYIFITQIKASPFWFLSKIYGE